MDVYEVVDQMERALVTAAARAGLAHLACEQRAGRLMSCLECAIMKYIWPLATRTSRPAAGPMTRRFCLQLLTPVRPYERPIVGAFLVKVTQDVIVHPLPGFTWSIDAVFVEREPHGFFCVTASETPIAPEES